ncbi:rho GTPase-activating protein 100F [Trichonephila clavata]|uniref:Rho GTPase-activating protein 100F n=1 Tax=Trichonephila clavata TaxID=2740835 RepID=A0A8X6K3U8_TRICU|nr:rho GTPase-activating protein 100F [Trichonephila clavata]
MKRLKTLKVHIDSQGLAAKSCSDLLPTDLRYKKAADEITQPLQPQAIATLTNRRRPTIDGSASDTEVTESTKNALAQRQRGVPRPAFAMPRPYGGNQAARSNSLPRVRMSEMDFRRFQQITQQQPASATVRLLPYDSQSDSDGALSSTELPAARSGRRDRGKFRIQCLDF